MRFRSASALLNGRVGPRLQPQFTQIPNPEFRIALQASVMLETSEGPVMLIFIASSASRIAFE